MVVHQFSNKIAYFVLLYNKYILNTYMNYFYIYEAFTLYR